MTVKILDEIRNCSNCIHSEIESMELVCHEWGEVIEDAECLCSAFEARGGGEENAG